ncbi:MAG TPA: carbon storage regulator CsrA [Candidatus Adamsella sp.]|nr:carbon storage regulator CsrA [Candidatus Adamsella sp.]
MLVLSRKTGEKLIINDNIEITIIETRGDSVKIGINAPKNVSIYREEIFEEIRKNNKQSANNILQTNIDDVINIINKNIKSDINYSTKFKLPLNKLEKDKSDE